VDRRRREEMPEPLFLRAQVAHVRGRHGDLKRDSLRDADPVPLELLDFRRVVRHEPHGGDPQDAQHARRALVVPEVRGESEDPVRIDRIEAVVLEVVCGDLVRDPDAPPFLGHVEQHPHGRATDSLHRRVELLAAIAPFGSEDVARHALGVEADEDVPLPRDPALDERDVLFSRVRTNKRVDPKVAVSRRQPGLASEEDVIAQLSL